MSVKEDFKRFFEVDNLKKLLDEQDELLIKLDLEIEVIERGF